LFRRSAADFLRQTPTGANLIIPDANHSLMRPRDLSFEEKQRFSDRIAALLSKREDILFAYVYGSFLHDSFRDIDLGVFLRDESSGAAEPLRYEMVLEQELEDATGVPIDVRVLNAAPLPFAYSILRTGEVFFSRDEKARCDFVCRIYTHYHDFAYYRKRYRREALGLVR
jgi:predicted nucleotidyltransferase